MADKVSEYRPNLLARGNLALNKFLDGGGVRTADPSLWEGGGIHG